MLHASENCSYPAAQLLWRLGQIQLRASKFSRLRTQSLACADASNLFHVRVSQPKRKGRRVNKDFRINMVVKIATALLDTNSIE